MIRVVFRRRRQPQIQQDIVIPLTLTLIAGWFVIGNLPGDWQPIAYTLMVVCVVAIFFYLFRKRIE